MSRKMEKSSYPCRLWEMEDAEEVGKGFRMTEVGSLGSDVTLEDGTLLPCMGT